MSTKRAIIINAEISSPIDSEHACNTMETAKKGKKKRKKEQQILLQNARIFECVL